VPNLVSRSTRKFQAARICRCKEKPDSLHFGFYKLGRVSIIHFAPPWRCALHMVARCKWIMFFENGRLFWQDNEELVPVRFVISVCHYV